jgi:hypothetical protein
MDDCGHAIGAADEITENAGQCPENFHANTRQITEESDVAGASNPTTKRIASNGTRIASNSRRTDDAGKLFLPVLTVSATKFIQSIEYFRSFPRE